MIKSMTGYGKSEMQFPTKKITIEIKSLNSKNLDINTRIPAAYKEKELTLRQIIAKELKRGKVDFSIFIEVTGETPTTKINKPIVKEYIEQLEEFVEADRVELLKMAVRFPDALYAEREAINEAEWNEVQQNTNTAIKKLIQYRTDEGANLEKDFVKRIHNIEHGLQEIEKIDPIRLQAIRDRLQKVIIELKEKIDENRLEQELLYYLEKLDITEEKIRLKNHLDYFIQTLNTNESNGKKLGFISQEIGREINTIGSKSNNASMQKVVVQMKDELEKIKEQLLNVL